MPRSRGIQTLLGTSGKAIPSTGEARRRLGSFKTCPGHAFPDTLDEARRRLGNSKADPDQVRRPLHPLSEARRRLGTFKTCPGHAASRPSWGPRGRSYPVQARQGHDLAVSRHAQVTRPPDPLGEARRQLGTFKTCPGHAASSPSWRGKETTWHFQDMPRSRGLQTLSGTSGKVIPSTGEARRRLGSFKTCPGHAASRHS